MLTINISGESALYSTNNISDRDAATINFINTKFRPVLEGQGFEYLGVHSNDTNSKFTFGIPGFNEYALILYYEKTTVNVKVGIGLVENIDNLSYKSINNDNVLKITNKTTSVDKTSYYYWTYEASLKVVKADNKIVALFFSNNTNNISYVFDEDHLGNMYITTAQGSSPAVYYDGGIDANLNNSGITTNDIIDTAYVENVCILKNSKLKAISKYMRRIINNAISSGKFKLIDIEGIKYRQMDSQWWVIEEE